MVSSKKTTSKGLKMLRNIGIGMAAAIVLALLVIFIAHNYFSAKEYSMLKEAGYINPVSAGDYNLNVCIYGNEQGKHTIVGLSGMGVNEFAVSVEPFMERFSDENKIAIIDRAGYGMSDDTDEEQTIERIVSDYRTVLKNAGCTAPYVLAAHSLGGNYATYWANTYPEEIEAVIYFDPAYILGDTTILDDHPGQEVWWEDETGYIDPIVQKMGLARLFIAVSDTKPWVSVADKGNEEYKKAFWEHSLCTNAQKSEAVCAKENMKKTEAVLKANDIPKLYIDAAYYTKEDMIEYVTVLYNNGMGKLLGEDINPESTESMDKFWESSSKERQETYERFIKNYVEKLGNCKYVNIPGDHYIYEYKPDEVEKEVQSFLDDCDR